MPIYTNLLKLYKPNRNDSIALDTSLSDNFDIIDNKLGSALQGSSSTYNTLAERLNEMEKSLRGDISKTFVVTDNRNVKGDGINDDTAGIQSVLNKANTSNGIRVVFPAGKYKVTQALVVKSNTHIILDQNAEILKMFNGGLLNNAEPTDVNYGYNGHGNIIVEGGIWNINAPTYSGGTPISFIHGQNIVFKDMIIKDVNNGHAIEINACKNVLFSNVKAMGFYGNSTFEEAFQLDLSKSNETNPRYNGAWDHTPCMNVVIENCYVGPSDKNPSYGRGVGGHSATIGVRNANIVVKDNIFDNVREFAVRMYSTREAVISGNIFINCGSPILIDPPDVSDAEDTKDRNGEQTGGSQPVSGFVVSNNVIYGGGYYDAAIYLGGETSGNINNASVTGNVIYSYNGTKNAIDCRNVNKLTIGDNIISGTDVGSTGIYCLSCSKTTVIGNSIENVLGHGIQMSGTGNHYNTIIGNTLYAIGQNGIYVTNAIGVSIIGNTIGGASYNQTSTNNAINLTTNCELMTITGNIVRSAEGKTPQYALYATSSCSKIVRSGNNFSGLTVKDDSVGGKADGTDLI